MSKTSRRLLIGCGIVVAGLLIWDFADRHHSESVLQARKAALVARGEKLTIRELSPHPSPSAQTAASELSRLAWGFRDGPIITKNPPGAMKSVLPGKARVVWREPVLREDRKTNSWEDLAVELESSADALRQIRQVLRQPEIAFNLDYRQGFNMLLPHLAKTKSVAQHLSYAALLDLHEGRLNDAAANIEALIALPEAFRDEPLLISQLVRIAIAAIAFNNTWEALQADGWTDAQLAALQRRWEALDFMPPMTRSMKMERAMGLDIFEKVMNSDQTFSQIASMGGPGGGSSWPTAPADVSDLPQYLLSVAETAVSGAGEKAKLQLWRWRWASQDEAKFLQAYDQLLALPPSIDSGMAFAESRRQLSNRVDQFSAEISRAPRKYLLSGMLFPAVGKAFDKAGRIEMQRELVCAAIALKRYQLREHKPPATLADLVPDFLARVPRDHMDGHELRYHLDPDGTCLLYSVGDNGVDDGGNSDSSGAKPKSNYFAFGLDVVWPRAATPEEIARTEKSVTMSDQLRTVWEPPISPGSQRPSPP